MVEEAQYDWQGWRVRHVTPRETVRSVSDGWQPLLVTDDGGTPPPHDTYGAGQVLVGCDDVSEGPQVALRDALGSVVGLMRPDGRLQGRTQ